jgi:hypothetical protein
LELKEITGANAVWNQCAKESEGLTHREQANNTPFRDEGGGKATTRSQTKPTEWGAVEKTSALIIVVAFL